MKITVSSKLGWHVKHITEVWNKLLHFEGNPIVKMAGINKRKNSWIRLITKKHNFNYPYFQEKEGR